MGASIRVMCAVLAAVACVLLVAPCWAQDAPSGGSDEEARAAFLRATELYERRAYARAELEFRRAWELMADHPRRALVLINVARCVEAQPGREREALGLYEQAIAETNALAAGDASIRDARQIAEERIAELNARFAAVEQDEPATSAERDVAAPVVMLASSGAVLLAGIATGAATAVEHGALAAACPSRLCSEADAGRIDTVRALGITTDVLLGVGAAAAAAGLVWLIVELSGGDAEEVPATAACGPEECSFTLQGSF